MIRKEENLGQGWDNPGFKGYARQEKAETGLQASFLLVKWGWHCKWEPVSVGGKLEEKDLVRKTVNEG